VLYTRLPAGPVRVSSQHHTHLTTFRGVLYNLHALGDFALVDDGPDFVVERR